LPWRAAFGGRVGHGQYAKWAVADWGLLVLPAAVNTGQGPKFTNQAFVNWPHTHGVRHMRVQPRRPMRSGYIEGFNGKRCGEHFNESWVKALRLARASLANWRRGYSEVRPHCSLARTAPARLRSQVEGQSG